MATKKRRPGRRRSKQKINYLAVFCLAFLCLLAFIVPSQFQEKNDVDKEKRAFITQLAPYARQAQRQYRVLASISLAQAILESDWNRSELSKNYHNLYGIKASGNQAGVQLATDEYVDGQWIKVSGRFAVYDSWQDSIDAHARLLAQGTSWNPSQYQHVLAANNYQEAATALVKDGYATDPDYASKIISLIKTWQLAQYDLVQ
ncbi:glycoside hydrolase family 73 protein [Eupransor demetentiae]|uniref:Flagellum-specific peptidoglycan hydrolase FlgJ (FlgJ) n=1 Tax=Eupransor demetentiae TaxID=3109584 RepID=A0ABM9N386_9LACO|nr:Flagellum-specific peptidoglycan hydrolase FlgJ (FlgJ) [Lactobacillaceae bacterium LMG 33000]